MIKKVMQPPVCAPKVEGFMLKPEYWIEKIEDAEKLILNEVEIYPETITREELLHTMKTYSSEDVFPNKSCYDIHANKIPKTFKKEVLHQANFEAIPDEIRVEWGMLIKREDV